jgi:hypothetical protein
MSKRNFEKIDDLFTYKLTSTPTTKIYFSIGVTFMSSNPNSVTREFHARVPASKPLTTKEVSFQVYKETPLRPLL